jgi:sugar phosphate isomerase/epimerase
MQLGFVSAILPDLSLAEVLHLAAEAGYACVEVMCWPVGRAERRYAGVTHIDVAALDDALVDEVQGLIAETGVSISGLGYYPNPLSPNQNEASVAIEHLRQVIAAAQQLGLDTVNTFIGRDWTRSIDDNWPRFAEVWPPLVALAEDHGVRIGIENCPMLFTADEWPGGKNLAISPQVWERMFAEIPSPSFGLNFDPSHLIWQQMDVARAVRQFGERITHVHAKDARLDRDRLDQVGILAHPLAYHTPKLPGMGDVNWGQFFAALTDTGYDGPVCVEVEDRAYEDTLAHRQAALRQSQRFLAQYVG